MKASSRKAVREALDWYIFFFPVVAPRFDGDLVHSCEHFFRTTERKRFTFLVAASRAPKIHGRRRPAI